MHCTIWLCSVPTTKRQWMLDEGALDRACRPNEISTTLNRSQSTTRSFCKRFKPHNQRDAYSTIEAPRAATEFLMEHDADRGACRQRNTGPKVKMEYVRTEEKDTSITIEINTDDHGEDLSWTLHDLSSGDEVASSTNLRDNRTHETRIYLNEGDYEFNIEDDIGDGLRGKGEIVLIASVQLALCDAQLFAFI